MVHFKIRLVNDFGRVEWMVNSKASPSGGRTLTFVREEKGIPPFVHTDLSKALVDARSAESIWANDWQHAELVKVTENGEEVVSR